MNVKHWALFFICILSSDFINSVSAGIRGGKQLCCKKRRITRNTSCRITPAGQTTLNDCMERIRDQMPDTIEADDQQVEEYEMTDITVSGFKGFRVQPYRCTCGRNLVRIFIRISFLRLLVTFVLSLLDGLLGGLLGGLGSALARLLGNVVNLLIRVLALDIIVQITILQRFIPGTTCVVESFRVSKLENITILGLSLRPLIPLLSPLLTPVLDLVFQLIFNGRVKEIFLLEIQKLIITRGMVTCP